MERQILLAQSGASPWLSGIVGLFGQAFIRRRIVAVTDKSIVVFATDLNGTNPRDVLRRLPRATQIGPAKGIWARINVGGGKTRSHAKFRRGGRRVAVASRVTHPQQGIVSRGVIG